MKPEVIGKKYPPNTLAFILQPDGLSRLLAAKAFIKVILKLLYGRLSSFADPAECRTFVIGKSASV